MPGTPAGFNAGRSTHLAGIPFSLANRLKPFVPDPAGENSEEVVRGKDFEVEIDSGVLVPPVEDRVRWRYQGHYLDR